MVNKASFQVSVGYFGCVGVFGTLFWVSGGVWGIILGGWVGKYFEWVRVGGDEWGWVGVRGVGCTVW